LDRLTDEVRVSAEIDGDSFADQVSADCDKEAGGARTYLKRATDRYRNGGRVPGDNQHRNHHEKALHRYTSVLGVRAYSSRTAMVVK
jgi:hypothetical protein